MVTKVACRVIPLLQKLTLRYAKMLILLPPRKGRQGWHRPFRKSPTFENGAGADAGIIFPHRLVLVPQ
jgi:hypothetical protein